MPLHARCQKRVYYYYVAGNTIEHMSITLRCRRCYYRRYFSPPAHDIDIDATPPFSSPLQLLTLISPFAMLRAFAATP